jgi:hypothetical protein
MDVTGIISQLRSERQEIERAIRCLETGRPGTGLTLATTRTGVANRRARERAMPPRDRRLRPDATRALPAEHDR